MNRRRFIAGAMAVLGAGAVVGVVANRPAADGAGPTGTGSDRAETEESVETATVRRGSLSTERDFAATVSFGDRWEITTGVTGTITESRAAGAVVEPGDWLVRVDDRPVTLARGAMPMYRELHRVNTRLRDGDGNRLELLEGADVSQLQTFLVGAGFDADGDMETDGQFGSATERAVEDWQESVGLAVTGRVDNSQLVFEAGPVRVAAEGRVGAPFTSLEVTGAQAKVLVDTSTRDRSALPVRAPVEVEADDAVVAGTVTDQKQVVAQDGSRVWRTTITVDRDLPAEVATATVTVSQVVADDVLVVPVAALLALSEGGFAVETTDGGPETTLVGVDVGQVLDGMAEISGDVGEGEMVVVPT